MYAIRSYYESLIEEVIRTGVARGEFRADLDARMATLALLDLGNSAVLWFSREPGATFERVTQNHIDLLMRAFRGERPAQGVTADEARRSGATTDA